MRRQTIAILIGALLCTFAGASPAAASFGLKQVGVEFTDADGSPALQAGSHPFATSVRLDVNTSPVSGGNELADGEVKDVSIDLPEGLVGDPFAVPRCSATDFFDVVDLRASCPDATALGIAAVKAEFDPLPQGSETFLHVPVFNLVPPPGTAARLGFVVLGIPVVVDGGLNPDPPYNVEATVTHVPQAAHFYGSVTTLWGDPGSPAHDPYRGGCLKTNQGSNIDEPISEGKCPFVLGERRAFFTAPRSCTGPLSSTFSISAWNTGESDTATSFTEPGMVGCSELAFKPRISAKPSSVQAESPSGLEFDLHLDDEGLTNPNEGATAGSDLKKAVVILPQGVTVNPSQAEGLAVCTEADLARESASSEFGEGCPAASKIGTVEVETPILEGEVLKGSLFVAAPYENRFGSLIALYQVIKSRELGVVVKLAGKVEPDPRTGRLITTFGVPGDELPQVPFSDFRLRFKEGARSPLVTPPACGNYETKALFTPWANPETPVTATAGFEIRTGVNAGPCPSGGLPPFKPGLVAGTLNNAAGHFSPFNIRLFRNDSEQEITRFSIKLPPGLVGKLAGIPFCPDAAIEAAKLRTGTQEEQNPSCPASSLIGRTLVGAGVGPALAYAPGKIYLAGPYNGSALSIAAITAAKVGPFDLGTVVVREGFKIDRETVEVFVDATGSDPIPHIIKGIPIHARDIRAYVDRPEFVLNPTNCTKTSTASTVLGSGLDFASEADDNPIVVSTPFQAADCAALPFNPKLKFSLLGGTKRGDHPKFRAHLKMRGIGGAAIARAQVTLPRSEFLDQSHIRTVCTRVQFRNEACPVGSIYGFAKAVTPLLDEPLQGPVYLRSSEHKLPDLVAALKNDMIAVDLLGRVDSVNGGISSTFEVVPDAPVDSFTLTMQGGNKGLLINSTNLCKGTHRARAKFTAHNGKVRNLKPVLRAKCHHRHRRH